MGKNSRLINNPDSFFIIESDSEPKKFNSINLFFPIQGSSLPRISLLITAALVLVILVALTIYMFYAIKRHYSVRNLLELIQIIDLFYFIRIKMEDQ